MLSRSLAKLAFWPRRLARDNRGAAAVEFSIVVVPFLGLLFAIFQVSFLFLVQQGLDRATERAARNIKTGQAMASNYTDAGTFCTSVIAPALPSFINCNSLTVDVRPATTAGSWSTTDVSSDILAGNTKFCIGGPGSVMVVRVLFPVPPMLSIVALNSSLNKISASTFGQATNGLSSSSTGAAYNTNGQQVYPIMGVYAFESEPFTASAYTPPAGC
jgi:Flp pilus assembly protein TadG